MSKKKKIELTYESVFSKRKKNIHPVATRDYPTVPVDRPAVIIEDEIQLQQLNGVTPNLSHTIPVQHDDTFGVPGVLGKVCQDRHLLANDALYAPSTDVKPS